MHAWMTVGDVPRHFARRSDADAVVAEDRTLTWRQIDATSSRVANALLAMGGGGTKVATLLPNCAEYLEIMYGVAKAGCAIVPLNSRMSQREVASAVEFAQARLLITTPELRKDVDVSVLEIGGSYENWRDAASDSDPQVPVSDESLYWLPFTSGTTGLPKAAMVSHRSLITHWGVVTQTFGVRSDEMMLVAGPFYHSLGFLFGLAGLYAGGRIAIHSSFEPARVLDSIEQLGVTMTPMVPTMYTMLLAQGSGSRDLTSLRTLVSAGSPLLTGTKLGLLDMFGSAGLYEFYGSTEIGVATALPPGDQRRKNRSVGFPVIGSQIRLLDEDGNDASEGEIYKRGLLLGPSYYNNPEATAACYRGEWMGTGDVARMDDEGYLYIVDRRKDMIVTGGANVFPSEIEEVISKHPSVLEVAIIGVPDDKWGEAIKAVIVPRAGAVVDADEIVALCAADLAGYKKPRSVDFVESLPKTGTGKILKRKLRELYWADEDTNVH